MRVKNPFGESLTGLAAKYNMTLLSNYIGCKLHGVASGYILVYLLMSRPLLKIWLK